MKIEAASSSETLAIQLIPHNAITPKHNLHHKEASYMALKIILFRYFFPCLLGSLLGYSRISYNSEEGGEVPFDSSVSKALSLLEWLQDSTKPKLTNNMLIPHALQNVSWEI
jgi:hypothetical protein